MFLFWEGEAPTAPSPPALSPGGGRFFRSAVVGFVSGRWRLPQSCVAGFSLSQLLGSVLDPVGALSVLLGSWFQMLCSVGWALDWIDEALRSEDKAWKRRVGLDGGSSVFLSSRFAVVELRRRLEMVADGVLSFHASCFLDARAYRNRPSLVWASGLITCLSGP